MTDADVGDSYENTEVIPTKNGIYIASVITTSGTSAMKVFTVQSLYARTLNILTPEILAVLGATNIEDIETALVSYGTNIDNTIVSTYQQYNELLNYEDTVDYSNSVNANGGFYVGRYEAGTTIKARTAGNNTATVTQIISENGTPVCRANQTPYNYITQNQAKGLAESMYQGKNYKCSLLTGAAWDRTLGFLTETGTNNKTLAQVYDDSGDWGNYWNVNFDVTNTYAKYSDNNAGLTYVEVKETYPKQVNTYILLTTGATGRNSAKNIYDLAGNVYECTHEINNGYSFVVYRGGSYNNNSDNAAYNRNNNSISNYNNNKGFRPALILF